MKKIREIKKVIKNLFRIIILLPIMLFVFIIIQSINNSVLSDFKIRKSIELSCVETSYIKKLSYKNKLKFLDGNTLPESFIGNNKFIVNEIMIDGHRIMNKNELYFLRKKPNRLFYGTLIDGNNITPYLIFDNFYSCNEHINSPIKKFYNDLIPIILIPFILITICSIIFIWLSLFIFISTIFKKIFLLINRGFK